ncbi:MAG: AAA family ATPase [Firmicutes bacterium HGW-Firmicutes-1]|nr:MAG: AAA family ATPase [Firmicutes bacterium HGW-Firmicutes-1]
MEQLEKVGNLAARIEEEVSKHIIGQKELIKDTIICLIAGGNMLLEGVPGLGKTRLVSTLGVALGLDHKRIQFTPDLMPADITGTNIYNKETGAFEFQKGPVFTNIVLADEINRATPKTQSAMLEAMQEKTITSGTTTYKLEKPYLVMATQNPIEQEGTYPLPEAQMDRFMFKLNVEFPTVDELLKIVTLTTGTSEPEIQVITEAKELLEVQAAAKLVPAAQPVLEYAMKLIAATHADSEFAPDVVKKYVRCGSSPRGAQAIVATARVRALMEGRFNIAFEDIKKMAYPVLRHRLLLNFDAISDGRDADSIITELLLSIEA